MAQVIPVGKIWMLHNIPWDDTYQHVKYFGSASAQHSWICSSAHILPNVSPNPKTAQNYVKDPLHGTIKVAARQENYNTCNYCCIQNTDISTTLDTGTGTLQGFYIYAFVNDVRYVSNSVIELDYSVDVMQTYLMQHKCTVQKSYIDRQHTQTDNIGEHIEPEGITSDRYVFKNGSTLHFYAGGISGWKVLVYASKARSEGNAIKAMGLRCGLPQGAYCNVFSGSGGGNAFAAFKDWLDGMTDEEYADWIQKIIAVVAVPGEMVSESSGGLADTNAWKNESIYINKQLSNLDGYTPTNKKLFTYPYNCHLVSDGDGASMEYAYEFFPSGDTMHFIGALAVQPQPEYIAAPYGYYGFPSERPNYDYKVSVKNFLPIPYVTDAYKSYLGTQGVNNAVNLLLNTVGGAIGGGIMTGNVAGAMIGATGALLKTEIGQEMQARSAKMGADGSHISSNGCMTALGQKTLYDCQKCICAADAERIDNYFSRFGYSQNKIDDVHFTNPRFNQHFVKTVGSVITGGAPAQAITKIKQALDSGVTFWKNNVGAYDL